MDITRLNELPEASTPLGGWARTLVERPDLRLVMLRVPAGEQVAEHTAPVEVVFVVLAGSGTVLADGQTAVLAAGEMLSCPAGIPRSLAAGSAGWELLVIRAPNR